MADELPPQPTKILLCVDGSENSEQAFNSFGLTGGFSVDKSAIELEMMRIKTHNDCLAESYIKLCNEANIQHKFELMSGDGGIDHAIMHYIKGNPDIVSVVMGTRGAGTLKRTFMGSISHHILHHSHIPVMVCPPPPHNHH